MALTTYTPLVQPREPEFVDGALDRRSRDLLRQACEGDSIAFARLFDLYADRIYDYMVFNQGDEKAAEDLTARVFLKAWRNITCYQPERTPFRVWLYLLSRSAAVEYSRSRPGLTQVREIVSPADEGLTKYDGFQPCEQAEV